MFLKLCIACIHTNIEIKSEKFWRYMQIIYAKNFLEEIYFESWV